MTPSSWTQTPKRRWAVRDDRADAIMRLIAFLCAAAFAVAAILGLLP